MSTLQDKILQKYFSRNISTVEEKLKFWFYGMHEEQLNIFVAFAILTFQYQIWHMKLKKEITHLSTLEQDWLYMLDVTYRLSSKIREAVILINFIFAGAGMAETRENDPLGSTSESENDDEEARQARRDRREKMKTLIVDETLLDISPERQHEQDEVESCADRLRRINTGGEVESSAVYSQIKKPNVPFVLKKPKASLNGAGGIALESHTKASLNGAPSVPVDRVNLYGTNTGMASQYGAIPEAVSNNGAYSSVNSLRKGMKTNPNLRGE